MEPRWNSAKLGYCREIITEGENVRIDEKIPFEFEVDRLVTYCNGKAFVEANV